jgi:hypothetical protein
MTYTDKTWNAHWAKAEKTLEEAVFLEKAGLFNGAYHLALGSCLQAAMAVSLRLSKERDLPDYIPRLRQFFRDGRLPNSLEKPFLEIIKAHAWEITKSDERNAKDASEAIQLAGIFQRAVISASDLAASHYSAKVIKAAAARGINMPPAPFK